MGIHGLHKNGGRGAVGGDRRAGGGFAAEKHHTAKKISVSQNLLYLNFCDTNPTVSQRENFESGDAGAERAI
jgi:hypothetical protein